jgi:hypothetical protein
MIDTAIVNTAVSDTAIVNTAVIDTAIIDTTVQSTAIINTAITDTAIIDTTVINSAIIDTAVIDTTVQDTAIIHTDITDTTITNITIIDTTITDTTITNNAISDTAIIDTATPAAAVPPASAVKASRPPAVSDRANLSREEFFRLAFGRDTPARASNFIVQLFVDGRRFGETEVEYGPDFADFEFASRPFARYLDTLLVPEERAKFDNAVFQGGRFNSGFLAALGYEVDINEQSYALRVTVPPDAKKLQRTSLGYAGRDLRGEEVLPARLSFYLNFYASGGYEYREQIYSESYAGAASDSSRRGRMPAECDIDGALSALGWVFEGGAGLRVPAGAEPPVIDSIIRGDVWATRDLVPLFSRLAVGEVRGFGSILGGETVLGARYEHNKSLFDNDPRDDIDAIEFFMPRAGHAELYRDGRLERTLALPAGHHEFRGFSKRLGKNRITLLLRMDDGGVEEIPFEFTVGDSRNLMKGEARYMAAAGFRRVPVSSPQTYEYKLEEPGVSADYAHGLGHFVTAGAAGQLSRGNGVFGSYAVWSFDSLGTMDWRGYANYAGSSGFGCRTDITFTADLARMAEKIAGAGHGAVPVKNLRFTLTGYLQSAAYSSGMFGGSESGLEAAGGVSGSFGFNLPRWNVFANGGVDFNRRPASGAEYGPADYRYGARATYSAGRGFLEAGAGASSRRGRYSPYLSLNGSYQFSLAKRHRFSLKGGAELRARHVDPFMERVAYSDEELEDPDFDGPEYRQAGGYDEYVPIYDAGFRWNWSNGVNFSDRGARAYSAGASVRNEAPAWNADAEQSCNRFNIRARYRHENSEYLHYAKRAHEANLRFGTSFMFADGLWAFGRPVSGNFVLAGTKDNLRGATAHIGRSARGETSRSGILGAAYRNVMPEYRPTEINLALSEIPAGVWFDKYQYHVRGAYRQGYALRIGEEKQTLVMLRIMHDGNPVPHTHATVEQEAPIGRFHYKTETFTSNSGILQLGDITPGQTYRVKFNPTSYIKDLVIEVPADVDDIFEMGDVEVEKE